MSGTNNFFPVKKTSSIDKCNYYYHQGARPRKRIAHDAERLTNTIMHPAPAKENL